MAAGKRQRLRLRGKLAVTSRCVVENLDIVRDQLCVDYAALSSGMATSSSWVLRSFMECSLK